MNGPASFAWLPFLALGWITLAVVISIADRKRRGKPVFPKIPADALFSERGCSGRSLDTPWGRIGGARNCLLVALTPKRLVIVPVFPFNLIFLPEIYGLDHNVSVPTIRDVVNRRGIWGRALTITYANPKVRRVGLRLRQPDQFLDNLRRLGVSITIA